MDKAFILQQLAYHQMIINGLQEKLQALQEHSPAFKAIQEAKEAVQSIEPKAITFWEFSDAVKAFAIKESKEAARTMLKAHSGVSVLREVDPKCYAQILEEIGSYHD
jgi:hypothetical protein